MAWNAGNQYKRLTVTINLLDGKTHSDYDLETFRTRLNPSYLVMGRETAPGTGRKHFQAYVEFGKKLQGQKIDRLFRMTFPLPHSVHYESSKGSAQQNKDYCSKEDKTPFEFGEPAAGQGARTDLATLFQKVKDGAGDLELVETDAAKWAVHRKALSEYRLLCQVKRSWPTQLIFLWGPTGTGKSMHAQELNPEVVTWTKGGFLNGFTGSNSVLLFDDFDWEAMPFRTWLTITDRYPMTINIKGGFANFAPKTIIFTSNDDPKTWWMEQAPAHSLEAIHRRMDEFGDIKMLGVLVPKAQLLLSKYFAKPAAAPTVSAPPVGPAAAGAGAGGVATPDTEIVDLTQDDDDDSEGNGQPKLRRSSTKRPRARDWDEHSDASNVDYAEDNDEWDAYDARFAPGCKHSKGCSTKACYCVH